MQHVTQIATHTKSSKSDFAAANSSLATPGVASGSWKEQSRKKPIQKKPENITNLPQDILEATHWSVPQRMALSELTASTPGVAFASPEEARSMIERPKSDFAQAILCSKNVTDAILEKIPVAVTDSKGQPAERYRYLLQLGKTNVLYDKSSIEFGGQVTARAVQVAITVKKEQ